MIEADFNPLSSRCLGSCFCWRCPGICIGAKKSESGVGEWVTRPKNQEMVFESEDLRIIVYICLEHI